MTTAKKIASIATAMTRSKRDDGTEFFHFTDTAPEELKNLYLEHYDVRDLDYEIFSGACDIVAEVYESHPTQEKAEEDIYERASDYASVYTSDRLAYLNMWNESDVSDLMHEYGMRSIADACAAWYDRQTEQAAIIISNWIHA